MVRIVAGGDDLLTAETPRAQRKAVVFSLAPGRGRERAKTQQTSCSGGQETLASALSDVLGLFTLHPFMKPNLNQGATIETDGLPYPVDLFDQ